MPWHEWEWCVCIFCAFVYARLCTQTDGFDRDVQHYYYLASVIIATMAVQAVWAVCSMLKMMIVY